MHISIAIDPLHKYPADEDLLEICGFLPEWVINPDYLHLPLREAMELQYGFGPLSEIQGGTVNGDYSYRYPGDPILYPYLIITRGDEVFVQYPYAIVAFIDETNHSAFVTRMD